MAKLIMLVGVPGSGKTTLSKRIVAKGFHYMNADSIRLELYGDEKTQGDPAAVFEIFFQKLEKAMAEKLSIIIDNTNLNPKHRKQILDRAATFAYQYEDIQLWLLDVPLATCLERNRKRERAVEEDIVTNMYHELYKNGRPKRTEGKVVVIRPSADGSDYLFFPQS